MKIYDLKFIEKLKSFGLTDPTFGELYSFFESKGIDFSVVKFGDKWFYTIHNPKTDYYFSDAKFDNPDFCELEMFKHIVLNYEEITNHNYDWSLTLTDEQKRQIEKGLDDVKNGRVVPHEEVMERIKQMLKNKKQTMKFKVGDKVYKPKGYKFPGTVVSVFQTTSGEVRIVAELADNGMLHIFSESQLELDIN